MTMIACTINKAAPVIIGDLLISDSTKPDKFVTPVLTEDVLQHLSADSKLHPIRLDQKIYILKPNVCIAFSGTVYYISKFLEDISIFCKAKETVNLEEMNRFLEGYKGADSLRYFSCIILIIEKEQEHFNVGRIMHGKWMGAESEIFGDVFASGSGSLDFLKEVKQNVKIRSQFPSDDINYTLQVNIITICKLLAGERLTLNSVKRHWGAGFEMIYFNGDHFTKLDNITYIINQGRFNDDGSITEVPVPAIILHYKYHRELLVITVIRSNRGTTQVTDTHIIISCKDYAIFQFIVAPINYQGSENFEELAKNVSFTSTKNAMAYLFETKGGYYLPASFNPSAELEITYNHPDSLEVKMLKGINDILVSEATAAFKNFK